MDQARAEFAPPERDYIRARILPARREKRGGEWVETGPATQEELAEFLLLAQTYGLDPLRRQLFATRRKGQLVIAPTIDGLRYLAARTRELDGQDEPKYGPEGSAGIPAWCSVTVYRRGFTAVVYWAEYARGNPTETQREMPRLMLTKATESQALRKAFPEALGGLITLEELGTSEEGGEAKEAPWQSPPPPAARRPETPRPDAAAALAAAREVAAAQSRRTQVRAQMDAAVGEGLRRSSATTAPDPPASRTAEHAAPPPVPTPAAAWCPRPGTDPATLGPALETVVVRQQGWSKGQVSVEVADAATGQKATLVFTGPEAALLATVRRDSRLWVRFLGDQIAAYHVPGAKAPGRRAG